MQPIYVEVSDEITTIIERIKNAPDTEVVCVVPRGAILLQSVVNLKLAKRAATELGKTIQLVTTDKIGTNLAGQLGISVLSRLEGISTEQEPTTSETAHLIDGVRIHRYYEEGGAAVEEEIIPEPIVPKKVLAEENHQSQTIPVPELPILTRKITPAISSVEVIEPTIKEVEKPLPPVITPKKPTPRKKIGGFWRTPQFLIALTIVVLAALLIPAYLFLPTTKAVVIIPAEKTQKEYEIAITAAAAENTVVGSIQSSETSDSTTFKTTGTKEVGEKAKGTARIINKNSTQTQTLPAGSKLTVSAKEFTTDSAVSVPGFTAKGGVITPGSAIASITASESGEPSNLSNATGSVSVAGVDLSDVYLIATTGGTTKQVFVATQTDIANAKQILTKKVQETSKKDLDAKTPVSNYIFNSENDQFTLDGFTTTAPSGTETEEIKVQGKGVLKRFVVPRDSINKYVEKMLLADFAGDKKIVVDSVEITKNQLKTSEQKGSVSVKTSLKLSPIFDTKILVEQVKGQSEESAKNTILAVLPGARITVTRGPAWWPFARFSRSTRYIQIIPQYE